MRHPYIIPQQAAPDDFPPLDQALEFPDGLLAMAGDLNVNRIITAYRLGIFPWYDHPPILWWSPNPRLVLFPSELKISRSLRKTIRKNTFLITLDHDFRGVIKACAAPRPDQDGTWITDEMQTAYIKLHDKGVAHSVEAWHEGRLVGGLYGIALGNVFFGESMFTVISDASKVAFACFVTQLQAWGYELIDCQVESQHLQSFGAVTISRPKFRSLLDTLCEQTGHHGKWAFDANH